MVKVFGSLMILLNLIAFKICLHGFLKNVELANHLVSEILEVCMQKDLIKVFRTQILVWHYQCCFLGGKHHYSTKIIVSADYHHQRYIATVMVKE